MTRAGEGSERRELVKAEGMGMRGGGREGQRGRGKGRGRERGKGRKRGERGEEEVVLLM